MLCRSSSSNLRFRVHTTGALEEVATVTTLVTCSLWPATHHKAQPWLYIRNRWAMDGCHGWNECAVQGMVENGRADIGQDSIQEWLA